jgi:hypothetical protein
VLVLFIAVDALCGLLRWSLSSVHQEALAYLPTVLGLGCVASHCLARPLGKGRLMVGLWLVFQSLVGCIFLDNPLQELFGIWVLAPVFMGFALMEEMENLRPGVFRILVLVYLALVIGILANVFVTYPWEGHRYEMAGQDIIGSKRWGAFGLARVAGTQRSSIGAAALAMMLCILLGHRASRRSLRAFFVVSAGAAIVVTTTKGVLLSWLVMAFSMALPALAASWFRKAVILAALAATLFLPLLGQALLQMLPVRNPVAWMLMASTDDRIMNVWPDALRQVAQHGSLIWGRGLGGLGTAQMYFEPHAFNPGDNMMLYLYGNLGIAGMALCACVCLRLLAGMDALGPGEGWVAPALMFCMTYGITNNNLENPALGLLIGMFIAKAAAPRTQDRLKERA